MIGIAGAKGCEDTTLVWNMLRALKREVSQEISVRGEADLRIGSERSNVANAICGPPCGHRVARSMSIAFTGEIYNLHALRHELGSKGHILDATSQLEVILHLYREYAEHCVDRLQGMFAFAISDGKSVFLARDRLGIKPLYYTLLRDTQTFLFASEIKALLRCKEIVPALDMQTFADSLVLNYPLGKRSFLENIYTVLPGSTMIIGNEQGTIEIAERHYFRPSIHPDEIHTINSAQERLGQLLNSAVRSRVKGDAGIGLMFSGGLDSTLLALLMKQHQPRGMQMFTIADQSDHADLVQAIRLVAKLEAEHHIVRVSFEDYLRAIPGCIAADEQPTALASLPLYLLCQGIRRKVKVFLTGEGADSLFGGQADYLDRFKVTRWLSNRVQAVKRLDMAPSAEVNTVVETILSDVDQDTYLKRIFEINLKDQLTRNHLEIIDKHSLAAGLECRLPYFDDDLVEFVNKLPLRFKADMRQGIEKYILKRFCLENYGFDFFDIVMRRKVGLPMACLAFFRRLNKFCLDTVSPDYKKRHQLGQCFADSFALLLFDMFCEIFLKYRGFPPVEFDALEFIRSAG